jgi:hypothetical protein
MPAPRTIPHSSASVASDEVRAFSAAKGFSNMGDKNPKSKQREKNQKNAEQTRAKNDQAARQAALSPNAGKEKKK